MAELAGLSVAANVAQFVVCGIQGAQFLYRAYRRTDDFKNERSELESLARSMRTSVASLTAASDADIKSDRELMDILDKSTSLAQILAIRMEDLQKHVERDGRLDKVKLAVKSLWNRFVRSPIRPPLEASDMVWD